MVHLHLRSAWYCSMLVRREWYLLLCMYSDTFLCKVEVGWYVLIVLALYSGIFRPWGEDNGTMCCILCNAHNRVYDSTYIGVQ